MNFLRPNNHRRESRTGRTLFVFTLAVLMLFGINYATNGIVADAVRVPMSGALNLGAAISTQTNAVGMSMTNKEELLAEREVLAARIQELELYALNNLVLRSENVELRTLLGDTTEAVPGVLARVLSHGESFPYGTMLIAAATESELTVGAPVFASENIAIGSVAETANPALVTLFSAPRHETRVHIGTEEHAAAVVVRGIGNGNMVAEVPRDVQLQVGDPVTLFSRETAIVGYVGNVSIEPTDAVQVLYIRTPVNIETVRLVHVR